MTAFSFAFTSLAQGEALPALHHRPAFEQLPGAQSGGSDRRVERQHVDVVSAGDFSSSYAGNQSIYLWASDSAGRTPG